jgi:phage terminase large subunit
MVLKKALMPPQRNTTVDFNVFAPSRPHEKQEIIWRDPARFKVIRAGRKFRKTSLCISWLAKKAITTGLVCPYIAPTRVQAKNIVWRDHVGRLLSEARSKHIKLNKNETELFVEFPGGGRLQLFGIDNQEGLRGISNWGAVVMDEYDDWAEDIWAYIIRPNLMTHQAPAIASGTPKGKKGLYRFVHNPRWKSFHFTSYDNPALAREELDDMVSEYKEMGEDVFRQEIMAEFVKPQGVVYKEFDDTRQVRDVPYDPSLPVHWTWDFGVNDPTAIIAMQPFGSELRVIDYYEASNADIAHFVQYIRSRPYREGSLHTGDIAGRAKTLTTGTSPITELAKHGIFIRTSSIPDIPTQVRITHISVPKLIIDRENAGRFIDCLENYKYPKKSVLLINQSNEIPIHDEWSHGMRAFEYYCWNTYGQTVDPASAGGASRKRVYDSSGRLLS